VTRHVIIIRNRADCERAAKWALAAKPGMSVTFKEASRSLDQNSLMWARLGDVARQVEWYGVFLSAEDWKTIFTASLRKSRVVPGLDAGNFVPLGMSTSEMSKAEMQDLLTLMEAFAAERGVVFSDEASDAA